MLTLTDPKNTMQLNAQKIEEAFHKFLDKQTKHEQTLQKSTKKLKGIFFTRDTTIIETVLKSVPSDQTLFTNFFFEPSCGQGVFLIKLILKAFIVSPQYPTICNFVKYNLFFVDSDPKMLESAKKNIQEIFLLLFNRRYHGEFNAFCRDFTKIDSHPLFSKNDELYKLYRQMDFVLGNPPYITLYGRRDQKKNESQRIYFLKNYSQFPDTLQNGKINFVMLFIEHGLMFLKDKGILSFIIDVSFFETAYKYCRKFIVQNFKILSLSYNLKGFDDVASGQLIIEIANEPPKNNKVKVFDAESGKTVYIEQAIWNNSDDEFKFRISYCKTCDEIIRVIFAKKDNTLKDLYPKKSLRTCTMLLNMENLFTGLEKKTSVKSYPFYRGSKGLKYKYSNLNYDKFFYYDKDLQDEVNDKLKNELELKGIKNKKRIGLGEKVIYENPKLYIRQSAKELIATYDKSPSSANNSLYVFSLRDNSESSIQFLKYLCGLLNSSIYTFFAQQRRIIRYNKGKQPQIKISDLYQVFIPNDNNLKRKIAFLVDEIYRSPATSEKHKIETDRLLYEYYELSVDQIKTVENAILNFQR